MPFSSGFLGSLLTLIFRGICGDDVAVESCAVS
jgi:hypothetical protein